MQKGPVGLGSPRAYAGDAGKANVHEINGVGRKKGDWRSGSGSGSGSFSEVAV